MTTVIASSKSTPATAIVPVIKERDTGLGQVSMALVPRLDGIGQTQKLGTDHQSGIGGRSVIDVETHMIVPNREADNADGIGRPVGIGYRKNRRVAQSVQIACNGLPVR